MCQGPTVIQVSTGMLRNLYHVWLGRETSGWRVAVSEEGQFDCKTTPILPGVGTGIWLCSTGNKSSLGISIYSSSTLLMDNIAHRLFQWRLASSTLVVVLSTHGRHFIMVHNHPYCPKTYICMWYDTEAFFTIHFCHFLGSISSTTFVIKTIKLRLSWQDSHCLSPATIKRQPSLDYNPIKQISG